MLPGGYVYILASKGRLLYTGVTSNLRLRVAQHKSRLHPDSFAARFNIDRLVYFELFESINQAIARETKIKLLLRVKKIQLIVAANPTWRDLSEDWSPQPPTATPGPPEPSEEPTNPSRHSERSEEPP